MSSNMINRFRGTIILSAIASLILGILFLSEPLLTGLTLCYFFGTVLIIAGLAKVILCFVSPTGVAESILGGIFSILIGVLCVYRPDIIADIIMLFAGIYVIADGAVMFSLGIANIREKISGGWFLAIASIILIICGIYIMFAPVTFIVVFAGISLILDAIMCIIVLIMSRKKN